MTNEVKYITTSRFSSVFFFIAGVLSSINYDQMVFERNEFAVFAPGNT